MSNATKIPLHLGHETACRYTCITFVIVIVTISIRDESVVEYVLCLSVGAWNRYCGDRFSNSILK